jgi:hypothetical protein
MGLKLIKTMGDGWPVYSLRREDNKRIATTRWPFDEPSLMIAKGAGIELQKLSHENCDELFGVINAEKLAIEHSESELSMYPETSSTLTESEVLRLRSLIQAHSYRGFEKGFNKALQLTATKVFTMKDMMDCWNTALKFQENQVTLGEFIQSLRPKEIEVEIEMVKVVDKTKVVGAVKGVKGSGHKIKTYKSVPKLDEKGCLILKKIEQ